MIKKLKLKKSQVIYVGDHIHDILEANKAKVRIVSVTTGVYSKQDLAKYKPYKIISNLNELMEIIT
jgi:phosphoglycolate phosphatase-like HAD superfamily hydrolase